MLSLRKTKPGFGLDLAGGAPKGAGFRVPRRWGWSGWRMPGICGSDVHAYEWTDGYGFMVPHLPVVMGHEFAGRIVRRRAWALRWRKGRSVTVMSGWLRRRVPQLREM